MNLNKVSLIGHLQDDPVRRTLPSGAALARFVLCTQHVWKDVETKGKKASAEYHDVVAWGKLAEIILEYVKRGSKVYVEGRLQTRKWEGKDGNRRRTTEVVATNLILLGNRRAEPGA